jgi:EAL domain-containing protein (putative c-di-GMP-specific phosphodiesterase class I)
MFKSLQDIGFRFAIDDFGTGYSSLANLKNFTVDKLKIDRSFVKDVTMNDSDRAIVEASIALAKALGLIAVAEGVETQEQKVFLENISCDLLQGYWFSKPLPPAKVAALFKEANAT